MLDVSDVTIGFDGTLVLDGVSLSVSEGEIVALLGPSGSGKSTLLRVVAGIVQASAGTVRVSGRDVTALPTHQRSVGMVFQDEQLFPHLTVRDNVAFGLRMSGMAKADRHGKADELISTVGLAGFGDRGVRELSGGEAKRVALARSLAPEPSVLLLDEPLTGLDKELHDELVVEIAGIIRATQTTAVWVTHDLTEAEAVADHTLRLTDL